MLPNGLEFYETVFAVWKLGACPVGVSAQLPEAELRQIIELADPRVVVGADTALSLGTATLPAGSAPGAGCSADPLPPAVSPHWKIMASGGSTGRPKLIVDGHPGLFDPEATLFGQPVGGTMLNPGPLYHNAPFIMTARALFNGGHIVEMGRFDPLRALALIEQHRIDWVNFVPTMMHRIWRLPAAQREAFDLSSLRVVFHMASPCPPWLKEAWIGWLGASRIFELYGGTEAQGITIIDGEEWLGHRGSVGKVQPGSRLRILNDAGEDCAVGEIGEIYFLPDGGRGSSYAYIGATARASGEWESIGDLGHLDAEGYLYLAERRTDLVISGGANIFPAEVEAAINEHPDVLSSITIGLPDPDLGQKLHAIVQVAEDARKRVDGEALRSFLATRLARYKIPRSFEFTGEPLRDEAGKARRSALRDDRAAAGRLLG